MRITRLAAVTMLCVGLVRPSHAALVPPIFLDCVVAIGSEVHQEVTQADGRKQSADSWFTEGTGFFYGKLVKDDLDASKRLYEVYLVTAKHVLDGHPANLELQIRVNTKQIEKAPWFSVPLNGPDGRPAWYRDDSADVAITKVDFNKLREAGLQVAAFTSDAQAAPISKLEQLHVASGDGIFVLGFPMNLAGADRNYVIARQGAIARLDDLVQHKSMGFLVDALVFPGNSGGPVILRPELAAINGTPPQLQSLLIGMVVSYISYDDVAVSQQTHQARVTFQENSGLSQVLPVDAVDAAIAKLQVQSGGQVPVEPEHVSPEHSAQPSPVQQK